MQPIDFTLETPFKYAGPAGAEIECNFIQLRPPTGKQAHICGAIEGLIKSAMMSMADMLGDDVMAQVQDTAAEAKAAEPDEPEEKDGEAMLTVMTSSGADMEKIMLHFHDLFKQVAWMGGEKQITSPRLDGMAYSDLRKMVGVYAANFILI